MPNTRPLRERRFLRLAGYDYRQPGAYFVTMVTFQREILFGHITNDEMHLNDFGCIALICWEEIPAHFPHVELGAFVVMPNHVHGILWITEYPSSPAGTPVGGTHAPPQPAGSREKKRTLTAQPLVLSEPSSAHINPLSAN
jgi:hypothetical protein